MVIFYSYVTNYQARSQLFPIPIPSIHPGLHGGDIIQTTAESSLAHVHVPAGANLRHPKDSRSR